MLSRYIAIILIFLSTLSYGEEKSVNILTWWGYLDNPWVSDVIQKECNVKISYDEYYSNGEFFRRFKENKQQYDILIFADPIYDTVKDELPQLLSSSLFQLSKDYHPIVRKQYENAHYPPNVIYLVHSVAGFLYNPDLIAINKADDIHSIFKKAKDMIVIIMDDPAETKLLLDSFSLEKFQALYKNSRLFVTNEFTQLYNRHDVAFSYQWSGQAIHYGKFSKKHYKFYVHPKYAYFATDLIATLKNSSAVECVARTLGSKKFLTRLQNETYYFSPYGNTDQIDDPDFKNLVKETFSNVDNLYWISSVSHKEFEKMNKIWNKIKFEANHDNKNIK